MDTSIARFSGRVWLQRRSFKPLCGQRQLRPAVWRLKCRASRGPAGDRDDGHCTRSDLEAYSSSSSNNLWRDQELQSPAAHRDIPSANSKKQSDADLSDRLGQWSANFASTADGYHPLEFYPSSQLGFQWGTNRGFEIGRDSSTSKTHGKIFVILFGVGSSDTEGIYSLRAVEQVDGLPVDTIVAFENKDDASRYSTLLEATMDHAPTVWPIEWGELQEFCNSAGYRYRLEPRGSLLIPPDYNVGMTDWEKSVRLRRGEFQVLESEPALHEDRHALADAAMYLEKCFAREPHVTRQPYLDSNVVDSQLADPTKIEQLRQRLEGLLPRD